MKRGLIKFVCLVTCLIIMLFSLNSIANSEDAIMSKAITGEATALTNASINVENAGPVITIYSPKEGRTYRNIFILLNYSAIDPDGVSLVWYNLDGTNISLGNSAENYIYFDTSEGNKTLFLYANDSFGLLNYNSVNFYVNNTKLIIVYESFRGPYKGNSSNFDSYTEDELENFSDMTLENANYGKIVWDEEINLTNDINSTDKITTLDYNVIIANQSIFVNTTELPNLNKSARLWFYSLNYTNPRVLMNGAACPVTICSNETYSNGTLSLIVTSFFNFTLQETPKPSGGGGGGAAKAISNFTLDKEKISISLQQGETKKEEITITNTGNKKLKINLNVEKLEDFMKISEESFELEAGESKTIILDIIAREEAIPNLYIGKLVVSSETIKKEVLIAIEVESKEPLFDVKAEIPEAFQTVYQGGNLVANIKIFNIQPVYGAGPIDISVEYFIRDKQDKQIFYENETMAVETQISFVKEIKLPRDTDYGNYFLYVKVTYDHKSASSVTSFYVSKKSISESVNPIYLILIFIILLLIITFIVFHELREFRKNLLKKVKIDENVLVEEDIIKFKKFDEGG